MSQAPVNDKWQQALDKELENLIQCQKSKNVPSCMKCEAVLNCSTRDTYIKAVYESMNKGSGGGFEF
jgi:hypothetical protein